MMGKVKKIALNQLKRKFKFVNEPFRHKMKSQYTRKVMRYANMYAKTEVDKRYVLYQVRDGKSMTDSPFAIFQYMLNDKAYKKFQHVWVVDNVRNQRKYAKQYQKYKNVRFIVKESNEYSYYLTKCKYLFNNATFPAYFTKKPDQIYVNTWHGTPLKHMGLDIPNNLVGSQNTIKNFISADYLISPNRHTTNIFKHAFKLEGLHEQSILEIGYPRIDATLNADEKHVVKALKQQGLNVKKKAPVLLFSPTWRGEQVHAPEDDVDEIIETIERLDKETDYQVFVKVHPFLFDKVKDNKKLKPYLIDDAFDTNALLSIVDLLVTDYSSIFFDYLVTDNPMIFFTPDSEKYEESRGLYLDKETLPGPTVSSIEALVEAVHNNSDHAEAFKENYASYKAQFVNLDDGHVTEKLMNIIFGNESETVLSPVTTKAKEKIVIYPGGMKPNGITTSVMNLLQNIDYERYDVTVFTGMTNKPEILANLNALHPKVRVILRRGPLIANTMEYYRHTLVRNRSIKSEMERRIYPTDLYEREFRKVFGNVDFDYAIDFSGYAMFWSELILASNAKRKIVYLHSDMKMDMERTVNGARPHYVNLKGIISMYPFFDKLVSVSEITKEENVKKVSTRKTKPKFASCNNTINLTKIREQMNDDSDIFTKNGQRVIVRQLDQHISSVPFEKDDFKVMAMGRLSPEKGFDNLITSFAGVVKRNPQAKLYILGNGPLKNQLEKRITSLGLENHVFLMGQKQNPFCIMKACDLFVLPSYYEGQSMVLLEAMTLGVNVLASRIPANEYVLNYGEFGMLSENDPESLTHSIQAFIDGDIPQYAKFDADAYNVRAVNQFYDLLKK